MRSFENKNIVIWGVGPLQVDIEAIYHLEHIVAYIDNGVEEKDLINVKSEQIISPENISNIKATELFFVLCTKDVDYAIRTLTKLGYTRTNYVLGEELLTNKEIFDGFKLLDVTIYGAGNTYLYWKRELESCEIDIRRFAVTKKSFDSFDGKPVIDIDELKLLKGKTRIIVSSIYYKEIFESLINAGFVPGYDFLQLDTFRALYHLTENINSNYKFINRSKCNRKLLVVLSGYKEFVWDSVFGRLEAYLPIDFDVCIVTSGKEDETMKNMCVKNQWSFLSTEINNVSLVTNLAISLHPDAEFIYKMDEDIFITEGTFDEMMNTYDKVERESDYEVGFVTPIIPVNGYGYARILDILSIRNEWENRFGEMKITDCYKHHMTIHDDPSAAEFLWGKDNTVMKSIDDIQHMLMQRKFSYSICPVRYSIGLILFSKNNWLRMGMFPVKSYENMGSDEKRICEFCMMEGRAMVVSENCIVGHLSYGPQHAVMEKYYYSNKEMFDVREV